MTSSPERLSASDQLAVAAGIINSFGGWVVNVDTRIATLSAAQAGLAFYVAARFGTAGGTPWIAVPPLAAFVVALAVAACLLTRAIRPRLNTGAALNHFVFPSVARHAPGELGEEDPAALLAQAWRQAYALSVIAMERYRLFTRALRWTVFSMFAAVLWIGVSAWR